MADLLNLEKWLKIGRPQASRRQSHNSSPSIMHLKKLPLAPLTRSSHLMMSHGSQLLVLGGEVVPRQPVDDLVMVCNLSQTEWASYPGAPLVVGSASASLGGTMYTFGGRVGKDISSCSDQLLSFDIQSKTWSKHATLQRPPGRSYHCMTSDGKDNLFVFGGCPEKGRLADLWQYTVSTQSWKQLPSMPDVGRGGAGMTFSRDKLIVFGGFCGHELDQLWTFDVMTETWMCIERTEPWPKARSVFAMGDLSSNIIVAGGEGSPSDIGHDGAGSFFSDIWHLDQSFKWTRLDNALDVPRGWLASCVSNDIMYMSGGLDANNQRLGDFWALSES